PGAIAAALARQRTAVHSVRALAKLTYSAPEDSGSARQILIAARPDRLRMEVLSPFGALFVLTAANGTLAAWERSSSTVYRGRATADNLARYAQVDLPVATAVDLLLGTPPIAIDGTAVVSEDDGLTKLWQEHQALVQVAWFNGALEPLRYEEQTEDGRVALRVTFDAYTNVGGRRVPSRLRVELPEAERRVEIALSETEINPELPPAVFVLQTPPGSQDVALDRAAQ
ncbi:MAG: LolA family protein, partial [Candidatus Binatia bacterium]